MKHNITFVVPTMNSIETIYECLESIKSFPVILVDKDSKDGTLEVAKKYKNVKIINQIGKGLANARNIGLDQVKTKYICNWGSDNVFPNRFIYVIENIDYLFNKHLYNWIGVAFKTNVENPISYFDRCINLWWKNKFQMGERTVIGTANIYKTKILKQFKYNEVCTHSDDSELGERLKDAGYKQGYWNYYVYDITKNDFYNILDRQCRYGKSDAEYHKKYCKTLKQKIKSYFHPFISNWIGFNLYYFPFWIFTSIIRFIGRFR